MTKVFLGSESMEHQLSNALSTMFLRHLVMFLHFETYALANPQKPALSGGSGVELDFLPHIYETGSQVESRIRPKVAVGRECVCGKMRFVRIDKAVSIRSSGRVENLGQRTLGLFCGRSEYENLMKIRAICERGAGDCPFHQNCVNSHVGCGRPVNSKDITKRT